MERFPFRVPGERAVDVVGLGENGIDHFCLVPAYPPCGGKARISRHEIQGGGQIATALLAVRRLGLRASYIGKVSDAPGARRSVEELAAEGVNVSAVVVAPGAPPPLSIIIVDEGSGERTVLWTQDAAVGVLPEEVPAELIRGARALHVDLTSLPATRHALQAARAAGTLTSIDADHVRPGVPELLADVDLCVVAETFPAELTGEADPARALRALRRFCPGGLLCVTLGRRGCLAIPPGEEAVVAVPAFDVRAVDTTSCGDVFHGALLFCVLQDFPLREALRFASAAAALNTRRLGGRPAVPTRGEVEAFLASHPPTGPAWPDGDG